MKIYNIKGTKKLSILELIGIIIVAIAFAPITIFLAVPLIKLAKYCKAKKYTVTKLSKDYHDKVKLIAHRGFRAVAPENTLPAFIEAGKANYWGAENDIHRTRDGVWVLQHDSYTYRMMSKNHKIEKTDFPVLLKANVDNGSNYKDYPNLKITKLDDYLTVCKQYNMVAVMELKGELNTEHYDEIVEMVKKHDVEAIYISFEKIAIETMRKLTDAPLFYIIYDITQEAVDFAKSVENCGIDFDGNDDRNKSQQKVDMIKNAGLEPAIWAVDNLELVKSYADWGVKYITSNQVCY